METVRSEELRRILREKRDASLQVSHKEMRRLMAGENRQAQGAGMEEGESSFFMQAEELRISQLSSQSRLIRQVELALDRLKHGSYGICSGCQEEISAERLRALPFALYCRDCQEELESRRRLKN